MTWLNHTHNEDMTNAERLIFQTMLIVASATAQWWYPFIGPFLMWTGFIVSDYGFYKLGIKDDKINDKDEPTAYDIKKGDEQ